QMFPSMSTQSTYKIVLDGAKKSGKTSILRRISRNEFVEQSEKDTEPIPHIVTHGVCIEGPRLVNLEIWERISSIDKEALYENVDASVFAYDITSRSSFEKALTRLQKIRQKSKGRGIYGLVGCKSDQMEEREVEMEEALEWARSESLDFCLEVSSKTPVNIPGVCTIIARKLDKRRATGDSQIPSPNEKSPLEGEESPIKKPKKNPVRKFFQSILCC
ncbi:hypothetical protein PFISCL1PPCAC_24243, partial [Pristionchus fissidentatus]